LAAWFGGRREGAEDVGIWLSGSDGKGWSAPQRVAVEPRVPCWNPVLFQLAGGEVLLFYKAGPSPREWSGFVRRSGDSGRTWGEAEILPAGLLGPIKNKPIQLEDGAVLSGTSVESYRTWACWTERSEDGCRTWSRHGPIYVPEEKNGIIQPTLLPRRDGSVLLLCRSTRRIGAICRSESSDGGHTWTPARPTEMPNPNAGIDAVRLADGRFVLAYNPTHTGRTPLVLSVSADDGETWRQAMVLEDEAGEYSYPAIIQARDGTVHVTYTWKRVRIGHVMVEAAELGG
jgi:predicted neuraminidase